MAPPAKQPDREPDSGLTKTVAGPGVAAEQAFAGDNLTTDVSVPDNLVAGLDYSTHPFPAGGVTLEPAPVVVDRGNALKAMVTLPEDKLRPIPTILSLPLPGREPRDYQSNTEGAKTYVVVAVKFNAAVGGDPEKKDLPRFMMCAAGDTIALTDVEAAWGLKCGAIQLPDQG